MRVKNQIKVSVFGAGGTGGAIAQMLAFDGFGEVALIDTIAGLAEGKALDIGQLGSLTGSDTHVTGGADVELSKGSDIVVITAGIGRRPGLNREDLIATNADVMQSISKSIAVLSPDARVIVLTNPADILTRIVIEATGFEAHRVVGQGGILDSARLATWIARLAHVHPEHVRAMVLGGHGDHMVPVRRFASIYGVPASHLLSEEDFQTAVERTRYGGGEILGKFQTHGAFVTPAQSVVMMVRALCSAVPQLYPISTRSGGTYGLAEDVVIGLPAKLSRLGVEAVLEVPLMEDELAQLHQSANTMTAAFQAWKDGSTLHQSE